MRLIHKRIRLRHGSLIRIIGSSCGLAPKNPEVYQYVVDMLWPDNKWRRILVSHLYNDCWTLMLQVNSYAQQSMNSFNIVYYVKVYRKKYGKEEIVPA